MPASRPCVNEDRTITEILEEDFNRIPQIPGRRNSRSDDRRVGHWCSKGSNSRDLDSEEFCSEVIKPEVKVNAGLRAQQDAKTIAKTETQGCSCDDGTELNVDGAWKNLRQHFSNDGTKPATFTKQHRQTETRGEPREDATELNVDGEWTNLRQHMSNDGIKGTSLAKRGSFTQNRVELREDATEVNIDGEWTNLRRHLSSDDTQPRRQAETRGQPREDATELNVDGKWTNLRQHISKAGHSKAAAIQKSAVKQSGLTGSRGDPCDEPTELIVDGEWKKMRQHPSKGDAKQKLPVTRPSEPRYKDLSKEPQYTEVERPYNAGNWAKKDDVRKASGQPIGNWVKKVDVEEPSELTEILKDGSWARKEDGRKAAGELIGKPSTKEDVGKTSEGTEILKDGNWMKKEDVGKACGESEVLHDGKWISMKKDLPSRSRSKHSESCDEATEVMGPARKLCPDGTEVFCDGMWKKACARANQENVEKTYEGTEVFEDGNWARKDEGRNPAGDFVRKPSEKADVGKASEETEVLKDGSWMRKELIGNACGESEVFQDGKWISKQKELPGRSRSKPLPVETKHAETCDGATEVIRPVSKLCPDGIEVFCDGVWKTARPGGNQQPAEARRRRVVMLNMEKPDEVEAFVFKFSPDGGAYVKRIKETAPTGHGVAIGDKLIRIGKTTCEKLRKADIQALWQTSQLEQLESECLRLEFFRPPIDSGN